MRFCRCGRPLIYAWAQDIHQKAASVLREVCSSSYTEREACPLRPIPRQEHLRIRKALEEVFMYPQAPQASRSVLRAKGIQSGTIGQQSGSDKSKTRHRAS